MYADGEEVLGAVEEDDGGEELCELPAGGGAEEDHGHDLLQDGLDCFFCTNGVGSDSRVLKESSQ